MKEQPGPGKRGRLRYAGISVYALFLLASGLLQLMRIENVESRKAV
jgi:hypothetical protein